MYYYIKQCSTGSLRGIYTCFISKCQPGHRLICASGAVRCVLCQHPQNVCVFGLVCVHVCVCVYLDCIFVFKVAVASCLTVVNSHTSVEFDFMT